MSANVPEGEIACPFTACCVLDIRSPLWDQHYAEKKLVMSLHSGNGQAAAKDCKAAGRAAGPSCQVAMRLRAWLGFDAVTCG